MDARLYRGLLSGIWEANQLRVGIGALTLSIILAMFPNYKTNAQEVTQHDHADCAAALAVAGDRADSDEYKRYALIAVVANAMENYGLNMSKQTQAQVNEALDMASAEVKRKRNLWETYEDKRVFEKSESCIENGGLLYATAAQIISKSL
jgi:hypothetical protein